MTLKRFIHISNHCRISVKSQDTKPESVIVATPLTEVTSINQTLNKVLGATSVVIVVFIVIAAMHGESINKIIIEISQITTKNPASLNRKEQSKIAQH